MGSNNSNEHSNLRLWLNFFRFILGTVVLTIIGLWVDYRIKTREIDLKEIEQIGQYIEYALMEDPAVRKRFAEYFSNVSSNPSTRDRWSAYLEAIQEEISVDFTSYQELFEEKHAILKEFKRVKDSISALNINENIKRQVTIEVDKEYERRVMDIELIQADLEANIVDIPRDLITGSDRPQRPAGVSLEVLSEDKLSRLLVELLSRWGDYCFNEARVKYWGSKRQAFIEFRNYSLPDIRKGLEDLFSVNVIRQGQCEDNTLYSIEDPDNSALQRFRELVR